MYSLFHEMNKYRLGRNFLFAGCFLLPTSGYIGPFLILLACVCGSSIQGFKALLAKKMYPIYLIAVLMLISALTSPFGLESCSGIFNWLPFFWLFWSLSVYFEDKSAIKRVALNLVYGTIPVLIIGFSQLVFGFNGSPRLFGSFIVWHVLDRGEFTGIFYNRNICAAWLAASFPFFVAAMHSQVTSRENFSKKIVALIALFSVSLAMVMSNSRNAIGSLFFGSISMIVDFFAAKHAIAKFNFSRFAFMALAAAIILFAVPYFGLAQASLNTLREFISDGNRLEIWKFGIDIASDNIFTGLGSGGFSSYVSLLSPFNKPYYHVHSLPLDLWISYGFLASITFVVYVFGWLFVAVRSGVLQDCIFSKAWAISFVLLIIVHFTDLPYLDARTNLVGWILFAGIVSYAESSALTSARPSKTAF